MAKIIVYGKGDLGISPVFGEIKKGRAYEIEEEQFAAGLFTREKPGFGTRDSASGKRKRPGTNPESLIPDPD